MDKLSRILKIIRYETESRALYIGSCILAIVVGSLLAYYSSRIGLALSYCYLLTFNMPMVILLSEYLNKKKQEIGIIYNCLPATTREIGSARALTYLILVGFFMLLQLAIGKLTGMPRSYLETMFTAPPIFAIMVYGYMILGDIFPSNTKLKRTILNIIGIAIYLIFFLIIIVYTDYWQETIAVFPFILFAISIFTYKRKI